MYRYIMDILPEEIILHVLNFCDYHALLIARCTAKLFLLHNEEEMKNIIMMYKSSPEFQLSLKFQWKLKHELNINPKVINYVNSLFGNNKEKVEYLQKMLGYCLTESIKKNTMFVWYGEGGGKSSLHNILEKMFGNFYKKIPSWILIGKKCDYSRIFKPAEFKNARIVNISELNIGVPKFKLHITLQDKSSFEYIDTDLLRRIHCIHCIHFNQVFVNNPTEPNEQVRNPQIPEDIMNFYMDDFFSWCCYGAKKYWDEGKLKLPECMVKDKQQFFH